MFKLFISCIEIVCRKRRRTRERHLAFLCISRGGGGQRKAKKIFKKTSPSNSSGR